MLLSAGKFLAGIIDLTSIISPPFSEGICSSRAGRREPPRARVKAPRGVAKLSFWRFARTDLPEVVFATEGKCKGKRRDEAV